MTNKKRLIGDYGEDLVVKYLEENSYQILERNYLKPYGEIDIIALKGQVLSFVEVKTRKDDSFAQAAEAVDYYKQQRLIRAAEAYIMEKKLGDYFMSFDVCEVYRASGKINYIENAFG
ncbi:MAG: YraN family protein [Anaerococcus sp.]|jgi:putative endonuclease|nr:YraN family protein [Peptoniphilaceae bacterium]MDY3055381.1 YraN family protein [Anaerococcus sp.]